MSSAQEPAGDVVAHGARRTVSQAALAGAIAEIEGALTGLRELERSRSAIRDGDVEGHAMMFWSYEELQQSLGQIDGALRPLRTPEGVGSNAAQPAAEDEPAPRTEEGGGRA